MKTRFLSLLLAMPAIAFGATNDIKIQQKTAAGSFPDRVFASESLIDSTLASFQSSIGLGSEDSVTFTGLTLSGVTASTLLYANGSKALASVTMGNSISLTGGTLDAIQDIRTSASPSFANATLSTKLTLSSTSGTSAGGIAFSTDGNLYRTGAAQLRWDGPSNDASFGISRGGTRTVELLSDGVGAYITALGSMFIRTNNGTTAVTLDASQNATIAGRTTITGAYSSTNALGLNITGSIPGVSLQDGDGGSSRNFTLTNGFNNSGVFELLYGTTAGGAPAATAYSFTVSTLASTIAGSMTTGAPASGTAAAWKLGLYDATGFAQIDIAGTAYRALAATLTGAYIQTQATLGNAVSQITSTTTDDDPTELVYQNKSTTTNATETTLHTFTIASSTSYVIEVRVTARRTGGTSGTANDSAGYIRTATVKDVSGTATLVGAVATTVTQEDQAGWDCTIDVTGGTARVRVTGAADNNVSWVMTARVYPISS